MDVLLEGGPRHQHWVSLPDPLPDVLVEGGGEYRRIGDSGAYAWVPTPDTYGEYCDTHNEEMQDHDCIDEVLSYVEVDDGVEHIRPAVPPTRTHAPTHRDAQ